MTPESLLQYTHPTPPAPGESLEVAPGVRWLRMPLPYALDHINLWLLEDEVNGEPAWSIVDCGLGNDATRSLWERIFDGDLQGRPVERIIVTHHHPDHAGQAGWLTRRTGVGIWMAQAEYLSAHAFGEGHGGYSFEHAAAMFLRNGLDAGLVATMRERRGSYRRVVPEFPKSYRRLMEGDTQRIGGREWRVIMGYGHAPEHAALYCESLGVLISGDMVLPRISTNVSVQAAEPESNPLALFLASIERYGSLPAETFTLPSHGLPFRGLRERVAQLQEHHRLRLAELYEVCNTPKAASEVLTTLFRRDLDVYHTYFAMGEAMAHLHYLHDAGRLERDAGPGGVVRYIQRRAA